MAKLTLQLLILTTSVFLYQASPTLLDDKTVKDASLNRIGAAESYVMIGDHEYYVPPNDLSLWMNVLDAMTFCQELGMTLMSLETAEENELVKAHLRDTGLASTPVWTSGQRLMNSWFWGGVAQEFAYSDWSFGNPNDVLARDVCVMLFGDGGWDDTDCYYSRLFICE